MYDLIIIGGGPAGSSAAITAARSGARVLLLERGRFPRHKVCGEFVSAESLNLLSSLLHSDHAHLLTDAPRMPQLRAYLDGRILRSPVEPPAASISRLELDAALWDSAARDGADALQQTTVQAVEGHDPFQLTSTVGTFESRAVINCSGRWSNLRASSSENGGTRATGSARKWLGLKTHFVEGSPSHTVDLYFFEGGYCGVSPVTVASEPSHERVNVCTMVWADVATTFEEVFRQNPDLESRAQGWQRLIEPVTTSPLIFHDPQPEQDGVLQAGDAATFVDPFVGDGISLALRSGTLAAQCLTRFIRGEITFAAAVNGYRNAYQQWLAPVFRNSTRIRRLLGLPRMFRIPIVSVLEKTPALTEYLVKTTR